MLTLHEHLGSHLIIGGVRVYPSRAAGFTLHYWWGSCLPFTSSWVHPPLLVGFVFTLHGHLGSPSIIGGVRAYPSGAARFTLHYWWGSCLPFTSSWVHPPLLVGFVLTLHEHLGSPSIIGGVRVYPSRAPGFTLDYWWGSCLPFTSSWVHPPLLVGFVFTLHEQLGSPSIIGGVRAYPSRAPGFSLDYWWGSCLPFSSTWVHPRLLVGFVLTLHEHLGSPSIIGGVRVYPSRAPGFTLHYWWGSCLPFTSTWVHPRLLVGFVFTLHEHLGSPSIIGGVRVYLSRAPGFSLHYWWGSCLPFTSTWVHPPLLVGFVFTLHEHLGSPSIIGGVRVYPSRAPGFTLDYWWGSCLPFTSTCVHPPLLVGFVFTLHQHLDSPSIIGGVRVYPSRAPGFTLHYWWGSCLPFTSTWVHPRLSVGFVFTLHEHLGSPSIIGGVRLYPSRAPGFTLHYWWGSSLPFTSNWVHPPLLVGFVFTLHEHLGSPSIIGGVRVYPSRASGFTLDYWRGSCLPFTSTWVRPRLLVGFVLTLQEHLGSPSIIGGVRLYPSRATGFTLHYWWGSCLPFTSTWVLPPLLVGFVFTFHEHLGSPSIIGGVRVYPSRAPGFTLHYWWGSCLPFTSIWVHPPLLVGFVFTLHEHLGSPSIIGGVRVYPSRAPVFTLHYWWGSCLPFTSTWIHHRLLVGFVFTLHEHLGSPSIIGGVRVYPSRAPGFTLDYRWGSCLPFTSTWVHPPLLVGFVFTLHEHLGSPSIIGGVRLYPSRATGFTLHYWWGSCLPFTSTWVLPPLLVGFVFTLHEHLGSPSIIGGVRVYPSRAPGFALDYWWGSCLPFRSSWVHPPLLVGFVFTLHEQLGSLSIIGGVRAYPSRAPGFSLDYWWGSCLPFSSTWVHPRLLVGFVLTLHEHVGSPSIIGGVRVYPSRAAGFTLHYWWGSCLPFTSSWVHPPLLVGFVLTLHEHLGSPSIIGGVRVYPSRAPGFTLDYWWGSCLPFTSTWVHPRLLVGFVFTLHEHLGSPSIIGGVRVYPSRAPGFTLDYWWGSCLPFTSTWVHPRLLVGFVFTFHEHLGSPSIIGGVRVYPSRAPGFTLHYWWGSCLPFTSIWVHPPLLVGFVFTLHEHLSSPSIIGGVRVYPSRAPVFTLHYWWGSCLPFTSTWIHPRLSVGFVFTLQEHLGSHSIIGGVRLYPSRAPGFTLHYWWGSSLPFTSNWVHPPLLVGFVFTLHEHLGSPSIIGGVRVYPSRASGFTLDYWRVSCLPFTSTWVRPRLLVGFVLTLQEQLGSPSIIGGVRVYPSRAAGFTLHYWWGSCLPFTSTWVLPRLLVGFVFTLLEHLGSPSIIGGVRVYPSRAAGFTLHFWWGSCLPFTSSWVHPPLLVGFVLTLHEHLGSPSIIGGVHVYPSRAPGFTLDYWWGSCLPFTSTWVHPRLLVGFVFTLHEHLGSPSIIGGVRVYPSRAPGFTLDYWWGSCLPFTSTWVHPPLLVGFVFTFHEHLGSPSIIGGVRVYPSRAPGFTLHYWWGSCLPFTSTWVHPRLSVGFVFTLHEHLGSPSIIGGVRVYLSRAPGFTLHYWWGSSLPFTSNWVHPPLLVGFVFTLHEHLGSPSIIGGVRVYPSRASGFTLDYWRGSCLPFTSTWVRPRLLVGFVLTLQEQLGSPSIIGGVRVYPSRAAWFTLHYWWGSCLPFTSTWVLPRLLVGFVFTLLEHLGSPSIIGGVRVYPSRAAGFTLHYWWGSCLPFTGSWVHPPLLVGFVLTLHEHLGSPSIIGGVRVYPSRAPGFTLDYWWGSCLPFTSTWVHPRLLVGFVFTLHEHMGSPSIIGGVRVYPTRAPGFTLDYWWGSCLPFTSTWVHPPLLVGFVFTFHEHLGSPSIIGGVRVYPSRAPGFTLHYWWGSCLPFTSIWVHPPLLVGFVFTLHEHLGSPSIIGGVRVYPSRAPVFTLHYWWGSCLPFTSTWIHPRLLVGFVFTLHEHLGSPSIIGGVRVYPSRAPGFTLHYWWGSSLPFTST